MILFNFKIAFRNMLKSKLFSAVNIIGLALSMACCLVIGLHVWNEINYDGFNKNLQHIYRITEQQNQSGVLYHVAVTPGPLAPNLQKDFPEIVNTVRFGSWSGLLKNEQHAFEQQKIQLTDNSIFKVFSFKLLKGNPDKALQSPDDIVITEKTADQYFGETWRSNPSILGQTFRLNNQTDFRLAGIVENIPENSSIQFDVLLPLSYLFNSDEWSYKWNSNNYHTYLQLKAGTNAKAFEKKMQNQLHTYNPESSDLLQLQPLKNQYLRSSFDFRTDWGKRSNIKYVEIFAGVGLLLLIIACVNFINLSTTRSLKRSMEVGIRKVNGASKRQLVFQFLSESLLVSLLSGMLSIFIIKISAPYLESITGKAININFYSPLFMLLFFGFIIITGVLAGLYPAFILSAFKPVQVLKGAGVAKKGKSLWQALVVAQFVISISLMICTFFMYRQLQYIQKKDLGFNKEQLISLRLKGALREKYGLFKRELEQQISIKATAPATMSLVNVDNAAYLEWDGMQPDEKFLITQANIDPDFIPVLGIQLLSGNNFSLQKPGDTANYMVNESAVKRMGYTTATAVGKQVNFWGAKGTIIGVVKDFNFKSLNTGIEPFIFRYQPWAGYFNLFIKIAPGNTTQAIQQLRRIYKKYETESPLNFSFINEEINNQYIEDTRTANLIFLFACLTVFVGCLGLFALTVFAAERRIKEIGIRKVLGAGIASLTGLLSKDFLKLVLIATSIATPIAWYITANWLQNFAYRINIEWWVFAAAGFVVVLIAFCTISIQSIKTAIANPVKSLRSE